MIQRPSITAITFAAVTLLASIPSTNTAIGAGAGIEVNGKQDQRH